MFEYQRYRADFPILQRQINGQSLVYLDNAATSQKPRVVIDAISEYYSQHNANVHRGVHTLGDESTRLFHESRQTIAKFFGADSEELIIVRNTTEAVNQVAYTWGEAEIKAGDILLATEFEHHSDLVPWQMLAERKQARLQFIGVTEEGLLDEVDLAAKLAQPQVKLLALSHVSNALGTVVPVEKIADQARRIHPDVKILVDGAQAAPHLPLNFHQLDVDFYVVSAHKMLGPMGIGGLLVKRSTLEKMPPFLFGGGMIDAVALEKTTFIEDLEERFTAGTPDVAGLVGWAAACTYLNSIGMEELAVYDGELVGYAYAELSKLPEVELVGPRPEQGRVGSVAFLYRGVHAHDVGQVLDSVGIAVRSGHHCTMPLHTKFGWPATARVSFQLYNSREDVDALIRGLAKVAEVLGQ